MRSFRHLFHRTLDIHRTEGLHSLLTAAIPFVQEKLKLRYASCIHTLFPVTRPYEVSGVPVPESVWYPHVKYEEQIPFYPPSASHVWEEEGVIKSHLSVTSRDDDIVIVGGGLGVTAVCASHKSETGSVTVFEASDDQATVVRNTLALNDVPTDWSVHEQAVGSQVFELYGDGSISATNHIGIASLPECDVLELDCEGSELSVIQGLSIRPRALIVEIHPHKGEFSATAVLDELEQMGYRIVRRYTHLGAELTHSELTDRLHERVETEGADLPPVIAAVQKKFNPPFDEEK